MCVSNFLSPPRRSVPAQEQLQRPRWRLNYKQNIQIMVNIRGIRNAFGGIRLGSAGDPGGIRMPLKGILAQHPFPMTHVLHNVRGIQVRPVTLIIILMRVNTKHGVLGESPHPVCSLLDTAGNMISKQEPHTTWLGEALACPGCFRMLPWTRLRGLTLYLFTWDACLSSARARAPLAWTRFRGLTL